MLRVKVSDVKEPAYFRTRAGRSLAFDEAGGAAVKEMGVARLVTCNPRMATTDSAGDLRHTPKGLLARRHGLGLAHGHKPGGPEVGGIGWRDGPAPFGVGDGEIAQAGKAFVLGGGLAGDEAETEGLAEDGDEDGAFHGEWIGYLTAQT
jgi:hypothetical protein